MTLAVLKADPELGSPLPLRLSQIVPDPRQPRKTFVQKAIEELADSIQTEGQETPVHVFKHPDPKVKGVFMLSAGERRIRAFRIIAERTGTDPIVLAYFKVIPDQKKQFRHAFLENLHREDLVPLDEAGAYAQFRKDGETVEGIAKLANRSISHVNNYLKMHEVLCPEVKALMDPNLSESEQLSVTSAIDIAKSVKRASLQLEIAKEIISRQLNVADTRLMLAERMGNPSYISGGRFRKPSDDYGVFKSFLGRTTRGVDRFALQELGRMYAFRDNDEEDRAADIRQMQNIKLQLDRMIAKLEEK